MANTLVHVIDLDTVGGVERLYHQWLQHPAAQGFTHHTLSYRNRLAPALAEGIRAGSRSVGFAKQWNGLPLPRSPGWLRRAHLRQTLARMQPDLLLVWNKPDGLDRRLLDPEIPVVYYEHGASWNAHRRDKIAHFLNQVSGIIANSHAAQRMVREKWRLSDAVPITVCPNAIRPDCLPENPRPKTRPQGEWTLGIAARLLPIKGIPLAIQALALLRQQHRPCRLRIAGTGELLPGLRGLVEQLGLGEAVRFDGLVADMATFYQQIDGLLCPSIREPWGLVAAEAMAHGCPVIAARVDGLPEVVSHDQTGWCLPPTLPMASDFGGKMPERVYHPDLDALVSPHMLDPAQLAAAIARWMDEPKTFETMSQTALASARQRFGFDAYAERLAGILRDGMN